MLRAFKMGAKKVISIDFNVLLHFDNLRVPTFFFLLDLYPLSHQNQSNEISCIYINFDLLDLFNTL